MANKFNGFMGDLLTGFLYPKGNLADYRHAARLYVDDTFRLAPKNKFLYYVVFNIAENVLSKSAFRDRHKLELNYLVKKMDLPKYTLETTTLNQYNRKTNVYTKITYDPISLTLHDDNNGVTNGLWALYYGYYFADRMNSNSPYEGTSPAAYALNSYDSKDGQPFRYGLDNDAFGRFFDSIELFTLSRHRFTSYMLCNPKITSWQHDQADQNDGSGVLENTMTLAYDAVLYDSGTVTQDDPTGFAMLHYDSTPSPIGNTYFQDNELLLRNSEDIFGDLFGSGTFAGTGSFLDTVRNSLLYYNNIGNRKPIGYGSPHLSKYGYQTTPYYSGGLQNYNFGSMGYLQNPYDPRLVAAGIGLAGVAVNGIGQALSGIGAGIGSIFGGNNPATGANSSIVENAARSVAGVAGSSSVADAFGDSYPPMPPRRPDGLGEAPLPTPRPDGIGEVQGPSYEQYYSETVGEPGYSGESGKLLEESTRFADIPQENTTAEILANSNYGGDAETAVGSPWG
jgi:hypothetical protein